MICRRRTLARGPRLADTFFVGCEPVSILVRSMMRKHFSRPVGRPCAGIPGPVPSQRAQIRQLDLFGVAVGKTDVDRPCPRERFGQRPPGLKANRKGGARLLESHRARSTLDSLDAPHARSRLTPFQPLRRACSGQSYRCSLDDGLSTNSNCFSWR